MFTARVASEPGGTKCATARKCWCAAPNFFHVHTPASTLPTPPTCCTPTTHHRRANPTRTSPRAVSAFRRARAHWWRVQVRGGCEVVGDVTHSCRFFETEHTRMARTWAGRAHRERNTKQCIIRPKHVGAPTEARKNAEIIMRPRCAMHIQHGQDGAAPTNRPLAATPGAETPPATPTSPPTTL